MLLSLLSLSTYYDSTGTLNCNDEHGYSHCTLLLTYKCKPKDGKDSPVNTLLVEERVWTPQT